MVIRAALCENLGNKDANHALIPEMPAHAFNGVSFANIHNFGLAIASKAILAKIGANARLLAAAERD